MNTSKPVLAVLLALGSLTTACSPMVEKSASSGPQAAAPSAPTQPAATPSAPSPQAATPTFHSFQVEGLDGQKRDLSEWRGKVVLVVNTASECGYTPQYEGLQKLHESMSSRGFAVLGFPSNDFGGQEPGTAAQIQEFCSTKFHVTFPLFAKVQVKAGDGQAPLYTWLGKEGGKLPAWNFSKYLIGKDGKVIAFWPSKTTPQDPELIAAVEKALAAG